MKRHYLFLILVLFTIACGSGSSSENNSVAEEMPVEDEDYFIVRYTYEGQEVEKKKTYKTDRVKAVYLNSANDNPAPAVYLQFPVFTESFVLNVQADKPGDYKVPHVDKHSLNLSFMVGQSKNGEGIAHDFQAEDVTVSIQSIELKADPTAKTSMGMKADGYANLKGTFKGTFTMETNRKSGKQKVENVTVAGEFMSGGNF